MSYNGSREKERPTGRLAEKKEVFMKYELEGNFTTAKLFRDVPELKYLPTAARERGMCGTFVQGTTQLFFVFGYDRKLIMEGDFIEIDGSLYNAREYLAERRVHIHSQHVLRKSFNAYPISRFHYSASETECLIEFMNDLERVMAISKEFRIPLTEYFHYSRTFGSLVRQYYDKLSTAFTQREADGLRQGLIFHFRSCMMISENPRPEDWGLTIEDYRTSAYCVDTNPAAIERAYRHPEKWESHLFGFTKDYADNAALSAVFVYGFIAGKLEELLRLHHIPYRFADVGKVSPKLMRHLAETDLGSRQDASGEPVILVYPAMYSMFIQYLMRWAFIDFYFTPEEKEKGYRLFQTGQFYGFSIPLIYQTVRFLRSRGIQLYSHELLQLRVLSGSTDTYCIAPLRQKPLVDAALMDYAAMQAYTHSQGSLKFYAASELRIPKWEGGHQISICEYGCEAGSPKDGGIAEMDYYNLHADHVPDEALKENGLLEEPADLCDFDRNRPSSDEPKEPASQDFFVWYQV